MDANERLDLYRIFVGLSNKLVEIAENSVSVNTADELHKLAEVVEESATMIIKGGRE